MRGSLIAAVVCIGLGACQSFEESALSVVAPASVAADGASVYDVEVCVVAEDLGEVEVLVEASSGEWLLPADANRLDAVTLQLDEATPCATDRWIVSNDLRPVRFRALVDGEMLGSAETNVTLAPLEAVEFSPSAPFLAEGGQSNISINVRGIVATEGETAGMAEPTLGTRIVLDVQSDPPSMAAVNDRLIVFGSAESRTLQAAAGTRQVTITARSNDGGRALGTLVLRTPGAP